MEKLSIKKVFFNKASIIIFFLIGIIILYGVNPDIFLVPGFNFLKISFAAFGFIFLFSNWDKVGTFNFNRINWFTVFVFILGLISIVSLFRSYYFD